jgi:4-hydroxy-3-polyprenylbenzoate decarboxylase
MKDRIQKRILVAVTGASGSIYAQRLLSVLLSQVSRAYLVATDAGLQVARHELGPVVESEQFSLVKALTGEVRPEDRETLRLCRNDDLFAPIASGSSAADAMIVVPCSMGTLARIATGQSTNLIERAADVMLKQKRTLVVVPRETPLSVIHLRNMLTLTEAGAHMVPPMPAFYQKPGSIEDMVNFVVGRVLECLNLPHDLYSPWNARMR